MSMMIVRSEERYATESKRKTWEKSVDSPGGGHVRACSSLRYVVVEDMVLFLIATTSEHDNRLKMVLLVTSDNEQFVVDKEVAERSVLIKNMLEG